VKALGRPHEVDRRVVLCEILQRYPRHHEPSIVEGVPVHDKPEMERTTHRSVVVHSIDNSFVPKKELPRFNLKRGKGVINRPKKIIDLDRSLEKVP
jgi:hypothetical protein